MLESDEARDYPVPEDEGPSLDFKERRMRGKKTGRIWIKFYVNPEPERCLYVAEDILCDVWRWL